MLGENCLEAFESELIIEQVSATNADVCCFMGVLEHLDNLQAMLDAVSHNKNIKYMFFLVPVFSLSCVFESAFQAVFNRLTFGGQHNHLFTNRSLEYMYKKYNFFQYPFGILELILWIYSVR